VRLPAVDRVGPAGPISVERQIKMFSFGAISITLRVPFEVANIMDLVKYHDLRFADGSRLHDEAIGLAEAARKELGPYLVRPVARLAEEEAYTVFCITSPLLAEAAGGTGGDGAPAKADGRVASEHLAAEDWLEGHRREVAALLTEERDITHLSDQETEESTSRYLSYYDHDMVVVDWDAALIVDEPRYIDEMVYLMELANLQLAELESYDRLLDNVTEGAYRDLSRTSRGRVSLRRWTGAKTLNELREIRVDLARLSDELSNITKFFGDWHLARIYQALSARFHLGDWHKTTDEKLRTLDGLYQLLQADRNNRYMLILEVTIVLLFVIDLIMLFRSGGH
jgi:hypothetical protein